MKSVKLVFILLMALSQKGYSQTRIYLNGGTNFSTFNSIDGFYSLGVGPRIFVTDNDYRSKKVGEYFNAGLDVDIKLNKLIHGVTGLGFFQAGYSNNFNQLDFSDLKMTFISVPLLLRVNFVNSFLVDVGPVMRFPIQANLKETVLKGTVNEISDEQDIASYLTPVSFGFTLQFSVVINRFTLTWYLLSGSTKVDSELENVWGIVDSGITQNRSLFLRDFQPKFQYQMTGFKVGIRLL